jgi:hypothetical protein
MAPSITVSLDATLAQRGIAVVFVLASGQVCASAAQTCAANWERAQADLKAISRPEKIFTHPHLQGYKDLHAGLGLDLGVAASMRGQLERELKLAVPQNRERPLTPSPESLIQILLRDGALRTLGTIVDLYNTVALTHLISAGAHDADKLGKNVALTMNTGEIDFRPLGQKKKQRLPLNEYSYTTDEHRAICRLECKQANETKLRPETSRWLFILQGNANISLDKLDLARQNLTDALAASISELKLSCATLDSTKLNGSLMLA